MKAPKSHANGQRLILIALLILFSLPASAQFPGRQGRSDELADYARAKKKKVAIARTYLQRADSNGNLIADKKDLVQVRHYDQLGRVLRDTIFHIDDGLPYLARQLRYEDARFVSSEEDVLSAETPMTNHVEYSLDDRGFLYLQVTNGGSSLADTIHYILDESGNVDHYIRKGGSQLDTVHCELNDDGRIIRSVTSPGTPIITEYTYNGAGQLLFMTETLDYGLLGQSEITRREFSYNKASLLAAIRDYQPDGRLMSAYICEYRNTKGKRVK